MTTQSPAAWKQAAPIFSLALSELTSWILSVDQPDKSFVFNVWIPNGETFTVRTQHVTEIRGSKEVGRPWELFVRFPKELTEEERKQVAWNLRCEWRDFCFALHYPEGLLDDARPDADAACGFEWSFDGSVMDSSFSDPLTRLRPSLELIRKAEILGVVVA